MGAAASIAKRDPKKDLALAIQIIKDNPLEADRFRVDEGSFIRLMEAFGIRDIKTTDVLMITYTNGKVVPCRLANMNGCTNCSLVQGSRCAKCAHGIRKDMVMFSFVDKGLHAMSCIVERVLIASGFLQEIAVLIGKIMVGIPDYVPRKICKACNDYCPTHYICECYIEHCVRLKCYVGDSDEEYSGED